ncbi:MAG: DEAD/DEAH box helicase [Treponema sp.]|nr:DEAD/DEAH box helicase [Treponema sp.]
MNYSELTLHEQLQKGIAEAGYVTCTPVQAQVLSTALDGSDLYVQSQTGTGKTAAYLVTIFQELLASEDKKGKKALVMVPTRELAVQVEDEAKKLGKYTGLTCESFYGGVGYEKQVAALKKGVDIIIGTPGRVIDLQEGKQMDVSNVSFLVVDEADRMFDMGFYPDLRKLIKVLPKSEARQTMLFSATLNSYVKNLAWEYTRDAKEITIEAENITVDEIDQELIHVSSDEKMSLLVGILEREKPASTIIFCNTKRMCEVLSKRLKLNGIESEFIIGDLPQSKRLKIMDNFKSGKVSCLVATDVAARGIDVNDLAMVVNYDLPNEAENYVHRIGRTARAGRSGKAYTFCSEQDVYSLVPIERYIEKQIPSRVCIAEDLGEDKSKGVFIRTEDWREEDGRSRRRGSRGRDDRNEGRRTGGERGNRQERGERSESENRRRRDRSGQRSDEKKRTERMGQEELNKIAAMSADERMKYYKEKYAGSSKKTAERARSEKGAIHAKGVKRSEKQMRRRNDAVPQTAKRSKNGSRRSERRENAAPKKLSLWGRLKSLIGRNK